MIADFERWIRDGAVDPRAGDGTSTKSHEIDIDAGRKHWAYQPLKSTTPPKVKNEAWPVTTSTDSFFKLEAAGPHPAEEAGKEVLARRLFIALIGLPPRPNKSKRSSTTRRRKRTSDSLIDYWTRSTSANAGPPLARRRAVRRVGHIARLCAR